MEQQINQPLQQPDPHLPPILLTMASHGFLLFFFLFLQHLHVTISLPDHSPGRSLLASAPGWQPMPCDAAMSSANPVCGSYLYVTPRGRDLSQVASDFAANASLVQRLTRRRLSGSETSDSEEEALLVSVPCACRVINATMAGLFHDTGYTVKGGDTGDAISSRTFSGLAMDAGGGDGHTLAIGERLVIHLPCGCSSTAPGEVLSYAVQDRDTLGAIASLFGSSSKDILDLNPSLKDPDFISPGWTLFVPMGVAGSSNRNVRRLPIIIAASISAAIFLLCVLTITLRLRRRSTTLHNVEAPAAHKMEKLPSNTSIAALESRFYPSMRINEIDPFQTERPVIFSLGVIEDATSSFDEKRKIGEGGYGSVYLGFIGAHEIAVKKMKASKSKEFFAELKVLCKVHHINVVELIGYAAGDDHLYLVYEYVQNGSLSEHLHDPLLKGHQSLSWTARTQIAVDSARGIEYVHDHTKTCYVHRDIKTSNILLDNGLRAKVADFGLVKLVQRSDEDECMATRLVGTPGYLPPESVLELHMTTKSDVYAFGVVLAELITGLRALVRDNKEANKTKSLISIMKKAFKPEDLESSLETIVDPYLKDSYPIEEVCKLANISMWCLSEDPLDRPEMREIMPILAQIHLASIEWEASLGGASEIFSGVSNGR
ncbi:lysM domain receptor-like kinase 3 isoform X1 [Oryza brachyantha]|uniref:lysM domain receptor-like kinase 3 isoform X1 n=1 Tax=Oryza brachyantha TaxID=4533 RepID=UPI00077605FA|nr:lysM domain receptor-like kinase 3 isoform X1 [Oryza brachyantha]